MAEDGLGTVGSGFIASLQQKGGRDCNEMRFVQRLPQAFAVFSIPTMLISGFEVRRHRPLRLPAPGRGGGGVSHSPHPLIYHCCHQCSSAGLVHRQEKKPKTRSIPSQTTVLAAASKSRWLQLVADLKLLRSGACIMKRPSTVWKKLSCRLADLIY